LIDWIDDEIDEARDTDKAADNFSSSDDKRGVDNEESDEDREEEREEDREEETEEDRHFWSDVERLCCRCDSNDSNRLFLSSFCSEISLFSLCFVSVAVVISPFNISLSL
jgi:hypothetical protein